MHSHRLHDLLFDPRKPSLVRLVQVHAEPVERRHQGGSLRFGPGPNGVPITLEQLPAKLQEAVAKNPDVKLAINADENAPWGKVVKIRDAAAEAKIKTLVAYTREAAKP